MTTLLRVHIDVRVDDEQAVYEAALTKMCEDGVSTDDATETLRPDGLVDVRACVQYLVDPGSPEEMQILNADCEVVG